MAGLDEHVGDVGLDRAFENELGANSAWIVPVADCCGPFLAFGQTVKDWLVIPSGQTVGDCLDGGSNGGRCKYRPPRIMEQNQHVRRQPKVG
jgi:hypothetical protein